MQVLSKSVAKAFEFYGDSAMEETQRFIQTFDTFFDCLNVRSPDEYFKRRKDNLKPYKNPNDTRLKVSITCINNLDKQWTSNLHHDIVYV